MGKRKIKIGVGDSRATTIVTFLLTQIAQQQTFSAATGSYKSQNREQGPGLIWVTSTQGVKKCNGFATVGKGCKLIVICHSLLPSFVQKSIPDIRCITV